VVKKGIKKTVAEAKVLDDKTATDLEKAVLVMKDGTTHEFTQFAGVFVERDENGEQVELECRSICHIALPIAEGLEIAKLLREMSTKMGKDSLLHLLEQLHDDVVMNGAPKAKP